LTEATNGKLLWTDFVPSPLAHPHCYSICYVLMLDGGGYVPFTRFLGRQRLFELLSDSIYIQPRERIEQFADGIDQPLILCAHTHLARAVRLADGRMIVNPGSVGSPGYRDVHPYPHVVEAGSPDARYAVLERADGDWQVTFRHVPYDHETMAALARRNGQPELANAIATGWIK